MPTKRSRLVTGLLCLVVVLLALHDARFWIKRQLPAPVLPPAPFGSSPAFREQAPLQELYGTTGGRIAMLGTSLTYRADWNALLHRCDVLNRGIPGDVTEGMLYRLPPLLADSSLRICFIEGGGNDLPQGLPLPRILANLHQLADTFIHRGVHAVLITTPYCSPVQANYRWINYRIAFLNAGLRYWAPKWGVPLLDLNMLLSGTAESLDPGFANEGDGVHLTAPAFALWSQAVNQMLSRMDI